LSTFTNPEEAPPPPELEARVRSELSDGEHLVWIGQPLPRRMLLASLPLVLFAIPFTGFACVWTMIASGIGGGIMVGVPGPARGFGAFGLVMALFGLPFLALGLAMLASPLWMLRSARMTCYALTDRRAILWNPNLSGSVSVRTFPAQALGRVSRVERADGTGDLIFEEYDTRDRHGHRRLMTTGFLGIRDVRAVENLLRKTLKV